MARGRIGKVELHIFGPHASLSSALEPKGREDDCYCPSHSNSLLPYFSIFGALWTDYLGPMIEMMDLIQFENMQVKSDADITNDIRKSGDHINR